MHPYDLLWAREETPRERIIYSIKCLANSTIDHVKVTSHDAKKC